MKERKKERAKKLNEQIQKYLHISKLGKILLKRKKDYNNFLA